MADIAKKNEELELVSAARSGDIQAFSKLVERYFGMVFAIAYSRLKNRETAEDLAQEVFLRIYLYLNEGRKPYNFAGWIVRITHNLITDWTRTNQRKSRLLPMISMEEMEFDLPEQNGKDVREAMDTQKKENAIHEAIFKLPAEQREIVLLHYVEGLSQKEIAERLEVHPSTVGRQLTKALVVMKDSLDSMVKDTLVPFCPSKKALLQTIACVSAVSLLSANAKAAVLESAGGKAWIVSVSQSIPTQISALSKFFVLLKNTAAVLAAGGKFMGAGKTIAIVAAATTVIFGGLHYQNKSNGESKPSAISASSQTYKPPIQIPASEFNSNNVKITPTSSFGMSTFNGNKEFRAECIDLFNLITNAYETNKSRVIVNAALPEQKFDVKAKLLLGQNDNVLKILQKAIESHFGLKVRKEKRNADVYVLSAPSALSSRLNAYISKDPNANMQISGGNGKLPGLNSFTLKDSQGREMIIVPTNKKQNPNIKDFIALDSKGKKVNIPAKDMNNNPNYQNFTGKDIAGLKGVKNLGKSLMFKNTTIKNLAGNLESRVNIPIIDETNLSGSRYNIEVDCDFNNLEEVKKVLLEKFGLELTPGNRKIEVLVVDKK